MATFTNDVELTILDGGGVVTVPGANVQLLIGCAEKGPIATPIATRNPNTLASVFGRGPLSEAGAMAINAGALVIAMRATSNVAGALTATSKTNALATPGTSVWTVSGVPFDTAYFKVYVDVGAQIGTAGAKFRVSMDGGRSYGPQYALGVAATFPIPDTGVTLNFSGTGSLTLVAGDTVTFKASEPLPNTAGVQACLAAIQSTPYGVEGWGSAHILGVWTGADATTIHGMLEAMKTAAKIFTRAIINLRDASPSAAYGGTGETEAAWMTAVMADVATVDAKRIAACAGHYNMSGQLQIGGVLPRYRRPFSWAYAARVASGIPPQRHAGRVKDGSLTQIQIDASNDPGDGFVYHDERMNPGLDDARLTSAQTRPKKGGYYVKNPRLLAALGSVFWLHPRGAVMDVACDILSDVGQDDINDDVRLQRNGTLDPIDARNLELRLARALKSNMTDAKMISDAAVVANRDWNVGDTFKVKVAATIYGRGYILEEDIEIGYGAD